MAKLKLDSNQMREYNMSVISYGPGKRVIVAKNCIGWEATNIGNDRVTVNSIPLYPSATYPIGNGDSQSITAHEGDVYVGNIDIAFEGVGNAPKVQIIQLFYKQIDT